MSELFVGEGSNPLRIVVPPPTPEQLKAREISQAVLDFYTNSARNAANLADFILSARLHADFNYQWDADRIIGEGLPTPEQIIAQPYTFEEVLDQRKASAKKDAVLAEQMRAKLGDLPPSPGLIKMTLRRVRMNRWMWDYRVLAEFPQGARVDRRFNPFDLSFPLDHPEIVLLSASSACVNHAADDLYKMHRQEPFLVPYRSRNQALDFLQQDAAGVNEYQLVKTPDEVVKQEAENYLLVPLQCGYSNELSVVPVSDFWYK